MNKNNALFSILFVASCGLIFAPPARGAELVNLAVISDTQANRLCVATETDGFDVRCYEPSPEILTGGIISATGISVSGVISASELWVNGVSITASGGSLISGLDDIGDVSATSPATGSILRFDGTDWTSVADLSTAISTTSIVAGWPDAIRCSGANGSFLLALAWRNAAGTTHAYQLLGDYGSQTVENNSPRLTFGAAGSTGTLIEGTGWSGWGTNCSGKTIAQLYSAGQAFNFLGNNGAQISLTEIADVSATAPADGEALVWNDAQNRWIPGTVAAGAATLASLTDVNATSPATNAYLVWNGSAWSAGVPISGCNAETIDFVPSMTAATTSGYTATGSSQYNASYPGWKAYDGIYNNGFGWTTSNGTTTGTLTLQIPSAQAVAAFAITANPSVGATVSPRTWTFEGSNNGSSWTVIDTQTNITSWSNSETKTFAFSNSTPYTYYRFNITANNGAAYVAIEEADLFRVNCSGADGLGNHSASTTVVMNSNDITGVGHFLGETISTTSNVEISGTIKISGTGNEACTTNNLGAMRVNPATGFLQMCR